MAFTDTYTLTFCDQAENHAGMQKIGSLAKNGFSVDELTTFHTLLTSKGVHSEIVRLSHDALVLVIRDGVNFLLNDNLAANNLYNEHKNLKPIWDKKAFMRGRVVNKLARHNLCFADFSQVAEYDKGKGTIIDFKKLDLTNKLRLSLPNIFGEKALNMMAEANYYYDLKKCYIGFHGDSERRRVIGIRIGASIPLFFQWYNNCIPFGPMTQILLNHGDIYIMSEKSVGNDWKRRKIPTLRHAAGLPSILKI